MTQEIPLPDAASRFAKLKEAVLQKRPILREILERWGHKTLLEYTRDYFSVNLNPPIKKRQDELISTVGDMVQEYFGPETADAAMSQLRKYYFVNTLDHHGPISHPWLLNANLLIAAPYIEKNDPDLRAVISFPCSNVSLNNASFPRGIAFHSAVKGDVKLHRLSFLPSNAHASSIYAFRPYTAVDLLKMRKLLREKVQAGEVHTREATLVHDLLSEVYDQPDILACETYTEQITKTNFKLWRKFFPVNGKAHPDLIFIEQEKLVIRLLIAFHLHEDTTINHLLFDESYDPLMRKYFDGVLNAFTIAERRGTYLFWGVSKDRNFRVQLWKKGNRLESDDGSFVVELTPEALQAALEKREIVPSIMLIFMVLSFYYGLKCLGGFNQVNYLTFMKNAYIKMQVDRGNYKSIEVCARAQTKETADGTIVFLRTPNGSLIPGTGLDFILYGGEDRWKHLIDEMKTMTVEDAMNPGMPDFYRFMYPGQDADPALASITAEQINSITGLQAKTRPCINIPSLT